MNYSINSFTGASEAPAYGEEALLLGVPPHSKEALANMLLALFVSPIAASTLAC